MHDIILFASQHQTLLLALFFLFIVLMVLEGIKLKRRASQLNPAQAIQCINHQNAVVIDLRSKELFTNGHIIQAVSIPFSELGTQMKKLESFKSKPLILVCGNGTESAQAASLLKNQGFTTHVLAQGLKSWREAEMPLIKG